MLAGCIGKQRWELVFALTHCNKLLGGGGVNGDSLVKVCFGSTHFNGHSKALQHLVATQALHVQTHHLGKRHDSVLELLLLVFIYINTNPQPVASKTTSV